MIFSFEKGVLIADNVLRHGVYCIAFVIV